jgi:hypothetical protein
MVWWPNSEQVKYFAGDSHDFAGTSLTLLTTGSHYFHLSLTYTMEIFWLGLISSSNLLGFLFHLRYPNVFYSITN